MKLSKAAAVFINIILSIGCTYTVTIFTGIGAFWQAIVFFTFFMVTNKLLLTSPEIV